MLFLLHGQRHKERQCKQEILQIQIKSGRIAKIYFVLLFLRELFNKYCFFIFDLRPCNETIIACIKSFDLLSNINKLNCNLY